MYFKQRTYVYTMHFLQYVNSDAEVTNTNMPEVGVTPLRRLSTLIANITSC